MALGDPNQDNIENPPISIVAPWDLNIDPSTIRFDPVGYFDMARTRAQQTIPPTTPGPIQDLQETPVSNQKYPWLSVPESEPLVTALDNGYADKSFVNPVEQIRDSIRLGDIEGIEKGKQKLVDLLGKTTLNPVEKFIDVYFNRGEVQRARQSAERMGADVVMHELMRPGSTLGPGAEEMSRMGLIKPNELLPGDQTQALYGHLIPQEPFTMNAEGMPDTSTVLMPYPAQPDQESSITSIIPGARLTPAQQAVVEARLAGATKGRQHADPAGLQEFNTDVQAQVDAHIEKTGQLPTRREFADFVAAARKRVPEEPLPGGLREKELNAKIASDEAARKRVEEQTKTEVLLRPEQIDEVKAKTTNLLAFAVQAMTNASDAVRKGDIAVHHAQLEQARVAMAEVRSQMQAIVFTMSEGDLKKEDKVKLQQLFLDLSETGVKISKRAGLLGLDLLDMGKPNISIEQVQPPGSRAPAPPTPPAQAPFGVNPFDFAPQPGRAPQPQPLVPSIAPLPPLAPPPTPTPLSDKQAHYNQLRRAGLSKTEAIKELERLDEIERGKTK